MQSTSHGLSRHVLTAGNIRSARPDRSGWCTWLAVWLLLFPGLMLNTALCLAQDAVPAAERLKAATAEEVLSVAGVTGGFVVELNAERPEFTAALRTNSGIQIQALLTDPLKVDEFRRELSEKTQYGEVSAMPFAGAELPYIDNLVNLLIIHRPAEIHRPTEVSRDELLRVLVPNGVLLEAVGDGEWQRTVKPRPSTIDDWSHYLHDSTAMPWLMTRKWHLHDICNGLAVPAGRGIMTGWRA